MKILLLLIIFVVCVTIGSSYAYALEYTYPTINQRLTEIPTYCAVESITDKIESSEMDEMLAKSELAVNAWREKLQNSEITNKEFWDLKFKKIGKNESVTDDCTITILFRDDPEFSGSLLSKTLGAFMRNSIYIYYENQESIYGDKWMDGILKTLIHEMGHTFGLGHYTTDDNDYNRKVATRDESPPSIMFAPAHINPDLRKITDIDVQKVRLIYGSYGFHAFSEQRPSEIIIENPISPLDPTYPFEFTEISKNNIKLFRHQDSLMTISGQINDVVFMSGHPVFLLITNPDLSTQVLKVKPTRDGFFETYLNFNYKSLPGKYSIEFAYIDKIDQSKNITFDVEQTDIPLPSKSENLNIIQVSNTADQFFDMGLYGDAIKNYKVVMKNVDKIQEPLHLNALSKIGLALIELKNYEKSLSYFEQVYEINPDYPNIQENLKTSKLLIETNGKVIIADSIIPLPGWIKSNAGWWINGQSTDQSLLDAFEYMQNKGLIGSYEFSNYSQSHIPNWLVDIVTWWFDGKLSDEEFLKTVDYLLKQGIIII
ncbi:tetratricopeptide repeat protein [Candidatus Nitrosopelagicus sp.]|nr:tetratricopeptide repeat protein [Candidatus Nitrosopelagicus sp.]